MPERGPAGLLATQGRLGQSGRRIVILDGAFRAPFGKAFVTAPHGKIEHG
jgi:hypothetical protein